MAIRFDDPREQFQDSNGYPISGGTLDFYQSGTSTRQDTFSDAALTTPNSNPVTLNSVGRLPNAVFLQAADYKVVFKDANGGLVWTEDPVQGALSITATNVNYTPDFTNATTQTVGDYLDGRVTVGKFLTSDDPTVDQSTELRNAIIALYESENQTLDLEGRQIGLSSDIRLRAGENGFTGFPAVERNRENRIVNGKLRWLGGDSADDTSDFLMDIGCSYSILTGSAFANLKFEDVVFDARNANKNLIRIFNFYNFELTRCHFLDYENGVACFYPNAEDDGTTGTPDNAPHHVDCRWANIPTDTGLNGVPIRSYVGDGTINGGWTEWTGPHDIHVGSWRVYDHHWSFGNSNAGQIRRGITFRDPRQIRVELCDFDNCNILITNDGFNSPLTHNALTNYRNIIIADNDFVGSDLTASGEGLITIQADGNATSDPVPVSNIVIRDNFASVFGQGDDAVDMLRITAVNGGTLGSVSGQYDYTMDGFGIRPGGDDLSPPSVLASSRTFFSGANDDGRFTRFSDGTQVCAWKVTFTQANNLRMSVRWNFPKPFSSNPFIGTPCLDSDSSNLTPNMQELTGVSLLDRAPSRIDFQFFRQPGQTDFGSSDTIDADVWAYGGWK